MRAVLGLLTVGLCAQTTFGKLLVLIEGAQPVIQKDGLRDEVTNALQEGTAAVAVHEAGGMPSGGRELQSEPVMVPTMFTLFGFDVDIAFDITVDVNIFIHNFDINVDVDVDVDIDVDVSVQGIGVVELDINEALLNDDRSGLCDTCAMEVLAGDCVSGACGGYNKDATNNNVGGSVRGDPHMMGLLGQKINWSGADNAWYCLLSDGPDFHVNVRLTAPMPEEFPDRQLISAVSVLTDDGLHSLVVEVKNPYSTDTAGCPKDSSVPCLADGGLRILVDGVESASMQAPAVKVRLPGTSPVVVSTANLPAECRPFGGDLIWASQFAELMAGKRRLLNNSLPFDQWIMLPETIAAPQWCAKRLKEGGASGLLSTHSDHATFRVETQVAAVRINVGVNYQDIESAPDGTVLVPELEFWQTDLGFDDLRLSSSVGGLMGDTSRFVLDDEGLPVTSGLGALHGPVESYRVAGPFSRDFEMLHG